MSENETDKFWWKKQWTSNYLVSISLKQYVFFFHTYTTNSLFCYAKKYTYVTCAMVQHISCWLNQFPGVIFKRIASLVISFCRWLRLFLSQREIGAIYPNNLLTPLGKRSFMQADRSGPIESDQKRGEISSSVTTRGPYSPPNWMRHV